MILEEPLICHLYTIFELYLIFPSCRFDTTNIEEFSWCTIRTTRIPDNLSLKSNNSLNHNSKISNTYILSCSEIEKYFSCFILFFCRRKMLHKMNASLRHIIRVKKFPKRSTISPESDIRKIIYFCFMKLTDHRWHHM